MKLGIYSFKPFAFKTITPARLSSVPQPRSGHRIASDGENLYSFGGYNPHIIDVDDDGALENDILPGADGMLFKELWRFNFASKTWIKILSDDNIPGDELASNAMVLVKDAILMVYGGTGIPFGINVSNDLYMYNLKRSSKMKLVEVHGHLPPKMYGQAILVTDHFLYTVGGTTGFDFSTDIHRLNLITNEWETVYISNGSIEIDPPGRYRHEIGFDGSKIFILGGGTSYSVYGFDDIPAFNLLTKEWELLPSRYDPLAPPPGIPPPRRCHGCVQVPSTLKRSPLMYISGGYSGSRIYNDVWKLELCNLQWTRISWCKLPRPVYFHSATVTRSGQMYTFGGIVQDNNNTKRTADVHSTWLVIPSLSEICWEAFKYYSVDLKEENKNHLLEIGVPKHFVELLK